MKNEKLQKVLARAGYGSRRQVEQWIIAGRIEVNGHTAELGERIDRKAKVYLDGKHCHRVGEPIPARVLLYHKPVEMVTTRDDPEGRETVFDALPPIREGRWINIGRLDYNTTGLLLFTNDGELAHRLMHPSTQVEREYVVRVLGNVTPEIAHRLTNGVELEDGKARFEHLVEGASRKGLNHWFHVVVVEGRNRVVRRLWESQGIRVNRLKRVRYGPVFLPKSLRPGAWLELEKDQVSNLWDFCKGNQSIKVKV